MKKKEYSKYYYDYDRNMSSTYPLKNNTITYTQITHHLNCIKKSIEHLELELEKINQK